MFDFTGNASPKFDLDQEVWVFIDHYNSDQYYLEKNPNWKRVAKASVHSVLCFLTRENGESVLKTYGYYLTNGWKNQYNGDEMFVTEEEAIAKGRWLSVIATDEQWMQAIGDRDIEEGEVIDGKISHSDSELTPCCASIAFVRDQLYICKNFGGLICYERDKILEAFDSHPEWLEDLSQDVRDGIISPLAHILMQLEMLQLN